jgi:hypothetical protein
MAQAIGTTMAVAASKGKQVVCLLTFFGSASKTLPDTLKALFPGAGGRGAQAGAKRHLVWDYKSRTFEHWALIPWNIPDNKYVDTVVA